MKNLKEIIIDTVKEYLIENIEEYSKWKRKNVTLRGIKEVDKPNEIYGSFGNGLYTVPLSNKPMAKQYGDLYFVVNARPKNPKIVQNLNMAEIFRDNLINDFCKKHDIKFSRTYFDNNTSMDKEMVKLGYDGLIISGREMVNYTPQDIKYFKTENELKGYYETLS